MNRDERLTLARVFVRASLALPTHHPVQEAIDAAVAALLDRQSTTTPTPERAAS